MSVVESVSNPPNGWHSRGTAPRGKHLRSGGSLDESRRRHCGDMHPWLPGTLHPYLGLVPVAIGVDKDGTPSCSSVTHLSRYSGMTSHRTWSDAAFSWRQGRAALVPLQCSLYMKSKMKKVTKQIKIKLPYVANPQNHFYSKLYRRQEIRLGGDGSHLHCNPVYREGRWYLHLNY